MLMEPIFDGMIVDRILKAFPEVWAIIGSGSAGTPFEHTGGDIDLAILLLQADSQCVACWELAQDLAALLKRDVDLVDLQRASTVLRHQIVSDGQRIYCAHGFPAGEFESRVLSDYVRLNESRRHILQDIQKRGRIHAG